jgi:hypothetical protein
MRSLKEIRLDSYKILGLRLRVGEWYKVFVNGDREFWLVRFYGVYGGNQFLHKGTAYVVYSQHDVREYPSSNGIYHGLCNVGEIGSVELVGLDYVESYGIDC